MERENRRIRVLIAKPGLDGHDRGAKVLMYGLRDEGMEVIYTGIRVSPEAVVRTALEESVDVIGLSSLSGGHTYHFQKVAELLAHKGAHDVLLVGGGIIPREDVQGLKEKGVKEIFGPGTDVSQVADFIRTNIER